MQEVLNQIIPILVTAIVGVLVVIIKGVGEAVVKYIETKKEEVISKIGIDKYNQEKTIAKDVFNLVEEHFRITEVVEDTMNAKIEMFDKLIKDKIPYITDEQVILLRQSIAGQFNAGKEVITK